MTITTPFTSLQSSIEHLKEDLSNFKETHLQRIHALEEKTTARPVVISTIPPLLPAPQENAEDTKNFSSFLRGSLMFSTKSLTAGEEPGSFTLPSYLQSRIQSDLEKRGSFRSLARNLSISSSFVDLLMDGTLPEARWVQEAEEREETEAATLRKIRIMVHELYAKPCATQKLLDDSSIDVESWLVEKVTQTMRKAENYSFLLGNGETQPKGILTYPTSPDDEREWGQLQEVYTGTPGDFHEGSPDALISLMHKLPTCYLEGAVWLMSSSALSRIRSLRTLTGHPYHGHTLEEPFRTQILGYPVILMDEMPPLLPHQASKSVIFGNLKEAYQIVDRQEMCILRDPYSNKPYIEFYINKRVGGDVVNFEALKILNFNRPLVQEEGEE